MPPGPGILIEVFVGAGLQNCYKLLISSILPSEARATLHLNSKLPSKGVQYFTFPGPPAPTQIQSFCLK